MPDLNFIKQENILVFKQHTFVEQSSCWSLESNVVVIARRIKYLLPVRKQKAYFKNWKEEMLFLACC